MQNSFPLFISSQNKELVSWHPPKVASIITNTWILNRAYMFQYIAMFIDDQNDLALATWSLFTWLLIFFTY